MMIKPVKKAPKAFADRYNRIVNGEETIDTIAKLKEFWLFAIEQGQPHPEMREYIAELLLNLPTPDRIHWTIYGHCLLHQAYIQIETFTAIEDSPNPDETNKQYHDRLWKDLRIFYIEPIPASEIDSTLQHYTHNDILTYKTILKIFDYSHKNTHCTH